MEVKDKVSVACAARRRELALSLIPFVLGMSVMGGIEDLRVACWGGSKRLVSVVVADEAEDDFGVDRAILGRPTAWSFPSVGVDPPLVAVGVVRGDDEPGVDRGCSAGFESVGVMVVADDEVDVVRAVFRRAATPSFVLAGEGPWFAVRFKGAEEDPRVACGGGSKRLVSVVVADEAKGDFGVGRAVGASTLRRVLPRVLGVVDL